MLKIKNSDTKMSSIVICYFLVFVALAHLILPISTSKSDFFIFFTWNLFSNPPRAVTFDISEDNGESFLFRDRNLSIFTIGEYRRIFFLAQNRDTKALSNFLKSSSRFFDFCLGAKKYKFSGGVADNFLFQRGRFIEKVPICSAP